MYIKERLRIFHMNIVYTFHAEEQIAERKIEKIWVEETIRQPDSANSRGNRYVVSRKLNGHALEVVYVKEKYIKVVTCYFLQ